VTVNNVAQPSIIHDQDVIHVSQHCQCATIKKTWSNPMSCTLTWIHTRKKVPMTRTCKTWGAAMLQVMMIRQVFPNHPAQIDGKPV
jgi:hypothetical protein